MVQLIKVQIRRDLALDVSAAPADSSLSALVPQAGTPVLPVARLTTKPTSPITPQQLSPALVTISNKNIIFPTTPSGETSGRELLSVNIMWSFLNNLSSTNCKKFYFEILSRLVRFKVMICVYSCCSCNAEAQLEVENGEVEVRWYLSSFAPPYVKVFFSFILPLFLRLFHYLNSLFSLICLLQENILILS